MRIAELLNLCEKPQLLDEKTLPELEVLLEEYPFFQTLRLLYLLNLQKVKDLNFIPELRKMAVCAVDNRKVYYLLEKNKFLPLEIDLLHNEIEKSYPDFTLVDFFLSTGSYAMSDQNQERSDDYVSNFLSEHETDEKTKPMPHQDVIDDFLEADKISPVKIVLSKNTEDIPPPLDNDLDQVNELTFFSETLSKIFIKQKKYDRALEILRKLSLLYPEKNSYFAAQIQILENTINNNK